MEITNILNVSIGPAKTIPALVKLTTSCQITKNASIEIAAQIVFS